MVLLTEFLMSIWRQLTHEETLSDKQLEKELVQISDAYFKAKTEPALLLAKEVGNMYTPSLYACLVSYLLKYVFMKALWI